MNSVSIEILSCAVIPFMFIVAIFTIFLPCGSGWSVDVSISGHGVFPLVYVTLLDTLRVSSLRRSPVFSTFIFWYIYDLSVYAHVFRPYRGLLHWLQYHLLSFRHCYSRSLCPLEDVECTGFRPYYLGRTVHLFVVPVVCQVLSLHPILPYCPVCCHGASRHVRQCLIFPHEVASCFLLQRRHLFPACQYPVPDCVRLTLVS